jgi:3D (Asp-Asp-Asp) domain-containing protein
MRTLTLLLVAVLITGCASTEKRKTGSHAGEHMTVRTTAYTQTEPGGSHNACGGRLHFGGDTFSAASDWSWLPLGTRFKMLCNGRTYVIEDYGSALVGKQTIDLYVPNRSTMRDWGVRNVDIEILEWGSSVMSMKLLAPRCKNHHVAVMVAQLRKQGVAEPSLAAAKVGGAGGGNNE